MILNHKETFAFTLRERAHTLTPSYVEEVHKLLVRDLEIAHELRRGEVGITGTSYRPLGITHQLREELARLCEQVNKAADPYSKTLLALVGISYLQPFADGNKRTARLVANALLIADDHAPLSYRTTDEVLYKESMLTFYEQLSLVPMKRIFTEQYLFACEQYLKV
jgi:Fic family protein